MVYGAARKLVGNKVKSGNKYLGTPTRKTVAVTPKVISSNW